MSSAWRLERALALLLCLGCGAGAAEDALGPPSPASAQTDESQTDESQTDESQTDESQTDESQTDESQTDESQTDESQTDESQTDESVHASMVPVDADSQSLGGPNDGSLRGAIALPLQGPGFRFNSRRSTDARFGTVEMVRALVDAAAAVHRRLGGEVTINDLGYEEGGPIPHHGSHRAGRDVDVLFYLLDEDGQPRPGVGAPLDPEGEGTDYRDLANPDDDMPVRIDLPRTWAFVAELLDKEDGAPDALQRIFLVEHLRTMLLAEARRQNAPERIVQRFSELTCQPSYPHDDHFHFRFFCSAEDIEGGCEESAPIYPWRRRALRQQGQRPVRNQPRRNRPTAPITTNEEARRAAGPIHPSVRRFLRRRNAWMDQPHPGRRWCR